MDPTRLYILQDFHILLSIVELKIEKGSELVKLVDFVVLDGEGTSRDVLRRFFTRATPVSFGQRGYKGFTH